MQIYIGHFDQVDNYCCYIFHVSTDSESEG